VTAWANKGNIVMNATNDVGTCTSGSTTINGRNVIRCPAGTNLQFTCGFPIQDRSVFLVVRGHEQLTTQFYAPLTRGTASTSQMAILFSRASSTSYHYNISLGAWTATKLNAQCAYETTPGASYRVTSPVPNFFNTTAMYGFVNASAAVANNVVTINGAEYRGGTTPTTLTTNGLAAGYDTGNIKYLINTSDTSGTYNTGMDYCEILYYNRVVTEAERKMIEGYLAWKWGIAKNDYITTPLSIPNCLAWYDADVDFTDATSRATSFTFSSGNVVQTWKDKSGNGYTATASTTRETLTPNLVNGRCGVFFGGTGGVAALTSALSLGTTQSFTMFTVAYGQSFGGVRGCVVANGYPGTVGGYVALQHSASSPAVWGWTGGTGFDGFTTGVTLGVSRPDVLSMTWSPGSCQQTVNGLKQPVSTTTPTTLTSGGQLLIGGLANSTTIANNWSGAMLEIIIYDGVLSDETRVSVETYLSNKWNLTNYIGKLINYHSSRSWRPPSRPILLSEFFSGITIWFDAADVSTVTGTSQVTNWVNKGSLGGSATNRTGSCTSGNTHNGLNYIRIPAGTDLGFTLAIPNGTNRAWFIVSRVNTVLTTGRSFGIIERTTSTTQLTLSGIFASTGYRTGTGRAAQSFITNADLSPSAMNNVYVGCFVTRNVAGASTITLNGTPQPLINSSTTPLDTSSVTYTIGRNQYNTSIDVMELISSTLVSTNERIQIEGYLAWKWGLQHLLPPTHPFSGSRLPQNIVRMEPLQTYRTRDFNGPPMVILWLDASDPYGTRELPSSGSSIPFWVDKSGYSRTVHQNTTSQRPVFTFDGTYPAIQFSAGSSQFLQSAEPLFSGGVYGGSYYVVCKPTSLASDSCVFQQAKKALTNAEPDSVYASIFGSSSGNNAFRIRYFTTTTKTASVAGTTDKMILAITDSGSASLVTQPFYKNGVQVTATLAGTTNLAQTDSGRAIVGAQCFSSTFSAFFTGLIYEIVVVRGLQPIQDRQYMEGYLAWKWGMNTSLPTTHPFYKIIP
jgi:hypothetical protein